MARSQMRHNVKDSAGNVIQNALCYVYLTGTVTAVSDMYAAESGGSPITTLTSNAQGDIEGWFDAAKTVDIKVTDNSNAAYYPSQPTQLLDWSDFTETVQVGSSGTSETVNPVAATGAAEALSFATPVHDVTMDEDCTFSFTGAVTGSAYSITVILRGAFTPTWPAAVTWPDGAEPTYGTPAVYTFLTVDGGTTILGFLAGATLS